MVLLYHWFWHNRQEKLWGNIELKTTSGDEYIQFTERTTKTRMGQDGNMHHDVPKIFSNPAIITCSVMKKCGNNFMMDFASLLCEQTYKARPRSPYYTTNLTVTSW